ncbi:hypothetical protein Ami103574_02300 [Aminipila butyrica]|uniref:Na+/glutamate symporter n=1 Tax=Aminipila butyrica TaxID=433296 RepID=A0A858BS92_9FIRM|nr:hypothetical protein [Aminipila butyrica]QIB68212.1 hypothetical protein Ami103574_02300 [Aminipila butyrica]
MSFSPIIAFLCVAAFLAIGEAVSTRTKAYIPSVFVTGVLFLIGYWTIMPKDLVDLGSFGPQFVSVCMSLLLVHMGTLMDIKKLIEQWKAVVVAVVGVAGTVLLAMTIGRMLFGYQFVVALTPPLTGGIVAAVLMSNALTEKGLVAMAAFPVAMFIVHSFIGYPVTSWCLKREGKRVLADFRLNGGAAVTLADNAEVAAVKKKWFPQIPENYLTSSLMLVKVMVVGIIAHQLSVLTNGMVNEYIICLVLGVLFCAMGFLEEGVLVKAGVFNWLMMGLLAYIMSKLNELTPALFLEIIIPIIVLILIGIAGMFVTSAISGRLVGLSKEMSFACALTALFGFPADYIITNEVCDSISETKEEKEHVANILVPRMLVGGFATVSIASVIIATIFVNLI